MTAILRVFAHAVESKSKVESYCSHRVQRFDTIVSASGTVKYPAISNPHIGSASGALGIVLA